MLTYFTSILYPDYFNVSETIHKVLSYVNGIKMLVAPSIMTNWTFQEVDLFRFSSD